jgi:hypothetical protein
MSGQTSMPTIVLIGGRLTLTDGSEVDSRQSVTDEKTARALQAALTSCTEWWLAVSSIVIPTLDECEGRFALIFGGRSIVRTALDGETCRSGLGKLLRGAVGSVSVMRSGINQSLPTDYQTLARLRGLPEGSDMAPSACASMIRCLGGASSMRVSTTLGWSRTVLVRAS